MVYSAERGLLDWHIHPLTGHGGQNHIVLVHRWILRFHCVCEGVVWWFTG